MLQKLESIFISTDRTEPSVHNGAVQCDRVLTAFETSP